MQAETTTKLEVGSIILIHGWPMLDKLEDGQKYRVASITPLHGIPTYTFTKAKGTKRIVRHYTHNVDLWVSTTSPDNNWIEKVA